MLYTTTITNNSARATDGVVVILRVPVGIQFAYSPDAVPSNTGCFTCVEGAEALWNLGTMAAGSVRIITVNALVLGTVLEGSLIPAVTEITATAIDDRMIIRTTVPAHQ